MNRRLLSLGTLASIALLFVFIFNTDFLHKNTTPKVEPTLLSKGEKKEKTLDDRRFFSEERAKYENMLSVNPTTGKIPAGDISRSIKAAALAAPSSLFRNNSCIGIERRGPGNLGGRTRGFAFDSRNADIILSGGVSGGLFRTTDGGSSWVRVSPDNAIHSVTTIVQDPTALDTWYYGTGEALGNSATLGSFFIGFGIWKSTDNGLTWAALTSTQAGTLESFDNGFDVVHRIVIDPTNGDIYAANADIVSRSTNDGASWSTAVGSLANTGPSDVAITSDGTIYASFTGTDGQEGVHRSTNGTTWTKIAGTGAASNPAGWSAAFSYGRVVLGVAPSDADIVYALYSNSTTSDCGGTPAPEAELFRWNDASSSWVDLSANLPDEGGCLNGNDPFAVQGGYDLCVAVKPDDANTVFIGGTNAYRSTDGFTSTNNTTRIGGYVSTASYGLYLNHHPDIHYFAFPPNNDDILYTGTDGGIHRADITNATVAWTSLNNDYFTYQYYDVDLDPRGGFDGIAGGTQDNGTTVSASGTNHNSAFGGDGAATQVISITSNTSFNVIASTQNGAFFRLVGVSAGFAIRPTGTSSSVFVTKGHLDQDNTNILFYADGTSLYRTRIGSTITSDAVGANPATGWQLMTNLNTTIGGSTIQSFATSRNRGFGATYGASDAGRRLYVGTTDSKVIRMNDPAFSNAGGVDISPAGATGVVSSISTNPNDTDEIIVTYANYGVPSVFHTSDASVASPTWSQVEGPAGGAVALASTRASAIVFGDNTTYFVGNSTGLYCTEILSGSTTNWTKVGTSIIGSALVSSMRYRDDDETLLVGTHGNGTFTLDLSACLPVEMLYYRGQPSRNGNLLTWKTATEQNNKQFNLLRSSNGIDFREIASVKGNGNSADENTYSYTDENPLTGTNYYALVQVDFDNTEEEVGVVVIQQKSFREIGIAPNPIKNNLIQLTISSAKQNEKAMISVMDLSGRVVLSQSKNIEANQVNQITMNASELSSGTYIITVSTPSFSQSKKFIK